MENRRHNRFPVDTLKISGKINLANTVDITDISVSGISLRTAKRLNIGGEYTLKIEEKNKNISIKGTVVWSTLHGSRKSASGDMVPLYLAGMEFTDVAYDKISELITFIGEHKQKGTGVGEVHDLSGRRFNLRFRINLDGKTTLDCPESFTVKKISISGMLIESKTPFESEDKLSMEFTLPDNTSIRFLGRVASCSPATDKDAIYAVGIEFSDMPQEHSRQLREFINRLDHQ